MAFSADVPAAGRITDQTAVRPSVPADPVTDALPTTDRNTDRPATAEENKGNAAQRSSRDCADRFFVRLYKFDAGGLTPAKENLCKMTENMQASGRQSAKHDLCAVLPKDINRGCSANKQSSRLI